MTDIIAAVEGEVKAVEQAVVAEAKVVEAKVEAVVEKTRVEITDAEKFAMAALENQFLKLSMQAKQLDEQIKSIQTTYPKKVEELVKRYAIDTEKWFFDGVDYFFKKKP